jgi:hypothetical protein
MKRLLWILVAMIAVSAQGHGQALRSQTSGKPHRIIADGTWEVVRKIGSDADVFELPIALATARDRIVVADAYTIKSFRLTGDPEWRFGQQGSGPGEFQQILNVAMDSSGNTVVYDDGLQRVTEISPTGKLRRVVSLASRTDRALFAANSTYLLLSPMSDTLTRIADSLGVTRSLQPIPGDLKAFNGTVRELSSIVPLRNGFQLTFRWSNRMLVLSAEGTVTSTCTGIDSLSFPDVLRRSIPVKIEGVKSFETTRADPRARQGAYHGAALGNQVLVEPSTAITRQHLLDVYGSNCGKYLESRPFPFKNTQLAGSRDLLIAIINEPVPHLVILRWAAREPKR